ncbi:hypothetical protein, variant [Aphanomyces astaci]|uniref:Condensin II complex subunit H2 N-terminal domain-containing protein n=1 Tax=Aphanomyces astaci TaxID=112090 RepID=W4G9K9_APHAT|nr:hypothetical protein, variant [Aphanomyces astaci]ETV76360.1 hypothetical protein, variant [Aphanomyces astaci]|eukprot:XP_009833905.1 hypothetical protein, variant [Aphanomyces astaci]
MDFTASSGDGGGTLSQLLDPLRELSVELDLASELEEYLQLINVDESVLVNFAQAALLVQQSSALYSKKVEHLYTLVLETLAHLQSTDVRDPSRASGKQATKKQKTNQGKATSTAVHGDDTTLTMADMRVEANQINWTVRTHVEESSKIDLPAPNVTLQKRRDKSTTTKTFQASMVMMGSFVSTDHDSGESLKLKSCRIDPETGALYLDDSSKDLLGYPRDTASLPLAAAAATSLAPPRLAVLTPVREEDSDTTSTSVRLSQEFNTQHETDEGDLANLPDFGWNDADLNEGNGMQGKYEEGTTAKEDHHRLSPSRPIQSTEISRYDLVQRHEIDMDDDKDDPWTLLDAYDATDCIVKPFQKGSTYRVRLPSMAKFNLAARAIDPIYIPEAPQLPRTTTRLDRLRHQLLSKPFKLFTATPSTPLTVEYAKCFANLQNPRASAWQFGVKLKGHIKADEAKDIANVDKMDDGDGGIEFEDGYNYDDEEDDDEMAHDVPTVKKIRPGTLSGTSPSGDEGDDEGRGVSIARNLDWNEETNESRQGSPQHPQPSSMSYEALCKQHIEQFMRGTEQYMKETAMSKLVADWQHKLTPVLDDQDRRPLFDIKASAQTIVHKLEQQHHPHKDATPVGFDQVVQDMSSYEICRIFSAVLHLVRWTRTFLHG